ncbi:hypothetical protein G6F59_018992 [Rhizopus arrhizus]|nr:hypothetical protein G6F59_018992 [Rhizopus arrhizus]
MRQPGPGKKCHKWCFVIGHPGTFWIPREASAARSGRRPAGCPGSRSCRRGSPPRVCRWPAPARRRRWGGPGFRQAG